MNDLPLENIPNAREIADTMMNQLMEWLTSWIEKPDRILTPDQIIFLGTLAVKNLTGEKLTKAERQMKTETHQKLRNSMIDIELMMLTGFIGDKSIWNPGEYGFGKDKLPFDMDYWKEDFPIERMSKFVTCLVAMFGDEYAIPLAGSIEIGLKARGENVGFEVELPLIKKQKIRV